MRPNQATVGRSPKVGKAKWVRKCASQSLSNVSDDAPRIAAITSTVPSTGRRRTTPSPARRVFPTAPKVLRSPAAPPKGVGEKPRSGMKSHRKIPNTMKPTPPATSGRPRVHASQSYRDADTHERG